MKGTADMPGRAVSYMTGDSLSTAQDDPAGGLMSTAGLAWLVRTPGVSFQSPLLTNIPGGPRSKRLKTFAYQILPNQESLDVPQFIF
jgi:hypothetical protein